MTLCRCVYVSSARLGALHHEAQVVQIVEHAMIANSIMGITGALMFDGTRFAQLLEGPPLAVLALVERIALDERHDEVVVVEQQMVKRRSFDRFSMAYSGNSVFVERTIALPLVKHEQRSKRAVRQLINMMQAFSR